MFFLKKNCYAKNKISDQKKLHYTFEFICESKWITRANENKCFDYKFLYRITDETAVNFFFYQMERKNTATCLKMQKLCITHKNRMVPPSSNIRNGFMLKFDDLNI